MAKPDGSRPGSSPIAAGPRAKGHTHVCPAWAGRLLCCPLRRWLEPPERLLAPHVHPGDTVLEPGCGMGWFSLPLARLVGPDGRVFCVDLQPGMIEGLARRARRAGLQERIVARLCREDDLGLQDLAERVDFAVAVHVVHEVSDPARFFDQIHAALKPSGRLLFLEPRGHVSAAALAAELEAARAAGFRKVGEATARRSFGAVLEKVELPAGVP